MRDSPRSSSGTRSRIDSHSCRIAPAHVRIDGNRAPSLEGVGFSCTYETIVQGDANDASIAAASILAKTARDRWMESVDALYPGYGFAAHKGYGTSAHELALRARGLSPQHRRSFRPIADYLASGEWPARERLVHVGHDRSE